MQHVAYCWMKTRWPDAGVSENRRIEWERHTGTVLPQVLSDLLGRQDGGWLRCSPIRIRQLHEIQPVAPEVWSGSEYSEADFVDPSIVLHFADATDGPYRFLLNYNSRGVGREPTIATWIEGEDRIYAAAEDLEAFLVGAVAWSESPTCDWGETRTERTILARQIANTIDAIVGPATVDQVLALKPGVLILHTRTKGSRGMNTAKTAIPLPLSATETKLYQFQSTTATNYALRIVTMSPGELERMESIRLGDGRWVNIDCLGVPLDVVVESADWALLDQLRESLSALE